MPPTTKLPAEPGSTLALCECYRLAMGGNKDATEQVLQEVMPRLRSIARRYFSPGHNEDDNLQILLTGAWLAISSFKADKVAKSQKDHNQIFRSWVAFMAERYLWRDFQSRNPERRGRNRTAELSECNSLFSPIDAGNPNSQLLNEMLEDSRATPPLKAVVEEETREWLHFLIQNLDAEKKKVVEMHYMQNQSFAEIGREMKMSREWISQLNKKALQRLKEWWSWEMQAEINLIDDMSQYLRQRWEYEKKYGLRLHESDELDKARPVAKRNLPPRR